VLIDGTTWRREAEQLPQQLGVVLQETFLFDGTIRENVLFSRPRRPKSS
jgi:ABC-type multidrug transport system fused ATPase/permease subunit